MPTTHALRPRALLLILAIVLCCAAATAEDVERAGEQLPGAAPHSAELLRQLADALNALGPGYEPRTEHLLDDGAPRFTNRLILESSPYLRQHAHNPVDWYPWGPEAFARAARENKPIFLSIGYSTCHWCHVMERESFDNVEIARLLNQLFVSIKVDRESRPDVDDVYMTAVRLQTGRGGWPMSSILTPEGKPFFGGTYFPPSVFANLLRNVNAAWLDQKEELLSRADKVQAAVDEALAAQSKAEELDAAIVEEAVRQLLSAFDSEHGGFAGSPKFPSENELLFLLQQASRGDRLAWTAVERSLIAMAEGGIFDQVGGGFHRYSTDELWLVPHFEKMLYNQANLSRAYAAAHDLTGELIYARVARQTLDYVLRDMTTPDGAFYSATDADSEGEEGRFFVWTPDELEAALGRQDAELAKALFGVTAEGNFEGRNILHLPEPLAGFAAARDLELDAFLDRVDTIREKLRRVREKREPPLRDDKVLTAWNSLMITALAEASEALDEPRYLDAAIRAADFLWQRQHKGEGELWRVHLDGRSTTTAVLDDYAFFAEALLALHDRTGKARFLARSRELVEGMIDRFWDPVDGGFFLSAKGSDPLLPTRPKNATDNAMPSGGSVAIRVLNRLAKRTGERAFQDKANASLAALGGTIERYPTAYSYLLLGVDELRRGMAGRHAIGAAGKVRAVGRMSATETSALRVSLRLDIAEGWHLNAHRPLQDDLIATVLSLGDDAAAWRLADVVYPDGERLRLSFQEEPLLLYTGAVEINARLFIDEAVSPSPLILPLRLRIQACDDRACLFPEDLLIEVPSPQPSQVSASK